MLRWHQRPGCSDLLIVVFVVVLLQCTFMDTSAQNNCGHLRQECGNESSNTNTFLPCISRAPGTDCMYRNVKGYTGTIPRATNLLFPRAPDNLTVSTYYIYGCKYPALNISWEIGIDGVIYTLKGFLLHVVNGKDVNITRIFNVSFNNTELKNTMQVLFYYPCIVADYTVNSWYKIKVYSLPLAFGNHDNSKEHTVFIPNITKIDANHTCDWSAPASVYYNKASGSVIAAFTPAPVDFGFSMYNIFVISGSDVVQQLAVNTTVDIQPHQLMPCMCRRGPKESDCCEFCTATDIPVTVSSDPVKSTVAVSTTPEALTSSETDVESRTATVVSQAALSAEFTETKDASEMTASHFVGIVIGVIAAVAALLAVVIYSIRHYNVVHTPRILVINCSKSESYVTAVRKFLIFLEAKCNLRVIAVDDDDCVIPMDSVQDWLMEEINLARKVVLFHSEESVLYAWRYVRSGIVNSVTLKTFVTALEMFSHSRVDQSKLLSVYFSYTPYSCVVLINCGKTYKLLDEFDVFLTDVCGSSFDSSSLLVTNEGRELQHAVEEAASYAEAHSFGFLPPDPDTDSIDNQSLLCMAATVGSD